MGKNLCGLQAKVTGELPLGSIGLGFRVKNFLVEGREHKDLIMVVGNKAPEHTDNLKPASAAQAGTSYEI